MSVGSHEYNWRDFMDISVRWRQISEPSDPVWWVDRLTTPPKARDPARDAYYATPGLFYDGSITGRSPMGIAKEQKISQLDRPYASFMVLALIDNLLVHKSYKKWSKHIAIPLSDASVGWFCYGWPTAS